MSLQVRQIYEFANNVSSVQLPNDLWSFYFWSTLELRYEVMAMTNNLNDKKIFADKLDPGIIIISSLHALMCKDKHYLLFHCCH